MKNTQTNTNQKKVAVIMGSTSDLPSMQLAIDTLKEFGVEVEARIVSAHRTPLLVTEFAQSAIENNISVIIAGAGGAAHLPGMIAAQTIVPVLGVPIKSRELNGIDSLLSIVQMPKGVPVGTLAIGDPGAKNAAYLALQILAIEDKVLRAKLQEFRSAQTQKVLQEKI